MSSTAVRAKIESLLGTQDPAAALTTYLAEVEDRAYRRGVSVGYDAHRDDVSYDDLEVAEDLDAEFEDEPAPRREIVDVVASL